MILTILYIIGGVVVAGVSVLILLLIQQNQKNAKYFQDRNVPYMGSGIPGFIKLITGKASFPDLEMLMYTTALKTGSPFVGYTDVFKNPAYYIMDLDLARNIYVKDFEHFVNRRKIPPPPKSKDSDLFSKMLTSMDSDEWKVLRASLSPAFTTGKIRRMFDSFDRSSERMARYLRKIVCPSGMDYDLTEAYSKYAMDVIASCAFGIDSKSFEYPPGKFSEFEFYGQQFQFKYTLTMLLKAVWTMLASKLKNTLGTQALDETPQSYFKNVITEVMTNRREKGERQEDFLQLMMDAQAGLLKSEESSKETLEVLTGTAEEESKSRLADEGSVTKLKLDDDIIVANCLLFFLAGFDTLQSLLIFVAYELAIEQEVQEKLYRKLKESLDTNGGKLSYAVLQETNYLDLVINETLRILPPAFRTERLCTKDYKIPATDVIIEKGQIVGLPVYAVHHDPKYYEDPEMFIPERFLPENKAKRHPYSFASFGHGPRNCIGMRFALIEAKAVIASLVLNFKLEPCGKSVIPPKFSSSAILKPLNGMWLNIHPRSEN